ncbi:ABC transporter, partial [Salinimicrobium sp. CDJ15-91]|nr:ABC transporter [Salinimicrobium oceani]
MKELKHLNKYLYKYKWHLIGGIFITIIARVFALVTPRFIGESTSAIERWVNGEVTSEAALRSELMTNILII